MKKGKVLLIALLSIVALLLIARLFVVDIVKVPEESMCPKAGEMALVSRWSYGYRLPWNASSRISYAQGKHDDWAAYNMPAATREEKADTSDVCIGRLAAIPGDTIWYNNESGSISVKKDQKKGFSHPLIVPAQKQTIKITNDNIQFYAITIMRHEPAKASIVDDKLCVSGKMVQQYTFQQDYYWIVSDDDKNLMDSRTFGFVPHASLIGKIK